MADDRDPDGVVREEGRESKAGGQGNERKEGGTGREGTAWRSDRVRASVM